MYKVLFLKLRCISPYFLEKISNFEREKNKPHVPHFAQSTRSTFWGVIMSSLKITRSTPVNFWRQEWTSRGIFFNPDLQLIPTDYHLCIQLLLPCKAELFLSQIVRRALLQISDLFVLFVFCNKHDKGWVSRSLCHQLVAQSDDFCHCQNMSTHWITETQADRCKLPATVNTNISTEIAWWQIVNKNREGIDELTFTGSQLPAEPVGWQLRRSQAKTVRFSMQTGPRLCLCFNRRHLS